MLTLLALSFSSCSDDDNIITDGSGTETGIVNLEGDIVSDTTLTATTDYRLTGTLSVKDGGVLRIPAGTTIKAEKGFSSYIIVEQGGKIYANGTSSAPVTITSAEENPAPADWGGLIINGKAPISGNTAGTTGLTEIDNNIPYGGTDSHDNSGILSYVILNYTGARNSSEIEHNGLTLDAVGDGTVINNLYIPNTADDGVECFGGCVDITNILVVDPDDDMFDNTQGYKGTITNAYGIWTAGYTSSEGDPRGVESDGNLDGNTPTDVGQTVFAINNLTIINNSTSQAMDDVIKIRRGSTATITNALTKNGTTGSIVNVYDSKSSANDNTSISLTVENVTYTDQYKNTDNITAAVNFNDTNTGADASEFNWTGYSF